MLELNSEATSCLDRLLKQIAHIRCVLRDGEILELHLQQLLGSALHGFAEPTVGKRKPPSGIDFGDTDDSLDKHSAKVVLSPAQSGFETCSGRHFRAYGKARNRNRDHENNEQQKRLLVRGGGKK